jgi:hypothetical protein
MGRSSLACRTQIKIRLEEIYLIYLEMKQDQTEKQALELVRSEVVKSPAVQTGLDFRIEHRPIRVLNVITT